MKEKNNRNIWNQILFIVSIILFISIQVFIYKFQKRLETNTEIGIEMFNTKLPKVENDINETIYMKNEIWQIQIPSINLTANIQNGTDKETLNKYVGHFKETQLEYGNIGLAAHNRGYEVNYFSKLKELKEGDEIIYKYNKTERIYEVVKNKIIKDTDVEILENTEENILTLITCVENEPEYRRCVQAKEKDLNYNY